MIFSFDLLRARKGDCFLLHCGSPEKPGLVIVDGGPTRVYKPSLKPRLQRIRRKRALDENTSLPVDLLMVSHVDDDHIRGLLDLTAEELVARDERRARMLRVLSFWHNSFDAVIAAPTTELTASLRGHFGEASLSGGADMPESAREEVEDSASEGEEVVTGSLLVLASIEQGFRLRTNAEGLGYPSNPEFDGGLIIAQSEPAHVTPDLRFTIVGPMQPEVEALREKHRQWLEKLAREGKTPPQALAAYIDKSVPNLSSLVVLAESGGRRMLLTGDARGDKILEGLRLVGLLGQADDARLEVAILKVPHHGSGNNVEADFFRRIVADHYVFSGNGEHGNPEREAMEMLFDARGTEPFTIHLTYPVALIDEEREKDWAREQKKEKARRERNPAARVRPDWAPGEHGLAAFFASRLAPGQELRFLPAEDDGKPHVIDLLDPLGY
jgi:hypothetical protein